MRKKTKKNLLILLLIVGVFLVLYFSVFQTALPFVKYTTWKGVDFVTVSSEEFVSSGTIEKRESCYVSSPSDQCYENWIINSNKIENSTNFIQSISSTKYGRDPPALKNFYTKTTSQNLKLNFSEVQQINIISDFSAGASCRNNAYGCGVSSSIQILLNDINIYILNGDTIAGGERKDFDLTIYKVGTRWFAKSGVLNISKEININENELYELTLITSGNPQGGIDEDRYYSTISIRDIIIAKTSQEVQELKNQLSLTSEELKALNLTLAQKIDLVNQLKGDIQAQVELINKLQLTFNEQAIIIQNLNASIIEQAKIISQLKLTNEQQLTIIQNLKLSISQQAEMINQLNINLQDKINLISKLQVTNENQARLIKEMNASFKEQADIINGLNKEITDDAIIIKNLYTNVDDQAKLIDELKYTNEELSRLVGELKKSVNDQAELISKLKLTNVQSQEVINQLTSNLQEQQLITQKLLEEKEKQKYNWIYYILIIALILFMIFIIIKKSSKRRKR